MKIILFYSNIILTLSLHVKAQNDNNEVLFNDSTVVLGVVSKDYVLICNEVSSSCICSTKSLEKGAIVVVSGTKNCTRNGYSSEFFFEIFYKNKPYHIKKEDLKLLNNIDYYSEISRLSKVQSDIFKSKAKITAAVLHSHTMDEALTFLENCETAGLAILNWNVYDQSEYTDGTGVKIEIHNPTEKAIKYITTTIIGYNAVGDKVYDHRKATYNCLVKSVGPIEPETSSLYNFDYVWFSDLVETAKIISIAVEYMDGTTKTITNPESIMLKKNLYNYLKVEN